MKRLVFLTSLVALLSLSLATPVLAAAPGNDAYADRVVIGSLPFSSSVDTTEATTDADDAEANASCGAPATDASVWYEFVAPGDGQFVVDMSASTTRPVSSWWAGLRGASCSNAVDRAA